LNVVALTLPPLRERKEDIPALTNYFLRRCAADTKKHFSTIADDAQEKLMAYSWPGNVRELANVIERAVILSQGKVLRLDLAMANILASSTPTADATSGQDPNLEILTEQQLTDLSRQNTLNALRASDWRVSGPNGAARLLGLKPTTLADRMKKLGISRPEQTAA